MAQGLGPHRVVEVNRVTDEDLTRVLNEMEAEGFSLEHIDYIKEVGVRRPQMAFVFFRRDEAAQEERDD